MAGHEGVHAFEVTRDKKVVWTFKDHDLVKSLTTVRALDDRSGQGPARPAAVTSSSR